MYQQKYVLIVVAIYKHKFICSFLQIKPHFQEER